MRISGRMIAVALALAVVVVGGFVAVSALRGRTGERPREVAAVVEARHVTPVAAVGSLVVLHDWDLARARAWAHGDVRALRNLYVDGSVAGRRDVAMLRRWTARGLRVRGMRMQVLGVRLTARSRRRIVLVVTDRLLAAYAVGGGRRIALPRDNASTRRLEFRRVDGRWLLASVRTVG